jgi:hypothetical protein
MGVTPWVRLLVDSGKIAAGDMRVEGGTGSPLPRSGQAKSKEVKGKVEGRSQAPHPSLDWTGVPVVTLRRAKGSREPQPYQGTPWQLSRRRIYC